MVDHRHDTEGRHCPSKGPCACTGACLRNKLRERFIGPFLNRKPPSISHTPTSQGWICPRCGTVNAPFVKECGCKEIKRIF